MSRSSSISFSLLHLLLLLSLAVCSCKARPIGVVKKQREPSQSSHFSSKDEEEPIHARVSVSPNDKPSAELDGSHVETTVKAKQPETARKGEHHHDQLEDGRRNEAAGAETIPSEQSKASVSWKLPHPKAGERQPGFNLDYDPPQTHPPVHN